MKKQLTKTEEEIIRATIGVENPERPYLSDVEDIYFKIRGIGEGITKKRLKSHLRTLKKKGYFESVENDREIKRVGLGDFKPTKAVKIIEYLGE